VHKKLSLRRFKAVDFLTEDQPMLHKCANSECSSPFRRLEEGKLFQVEVGPSPIFASGRGTAQRRRQVRQVERFWLCDKCSSLLTLTFEKGRGVVTVPLPNGAGKSALPAYVSELPMAAREIGSPVRWRNLERATV
jgi:hypothetical protein